MLDECIEKAGEANCDPASEPTDSRLIQLGNTIPLLFSMALLAALIYAFQNPADPQIAAPSTITILLFFAAILSPKNRRQNWRTRIFGGLALLLGLVFSQVGEAVLFFTCLSLVGLLVIVTCVRPFLRFNLRTTLTMISLSMALGIVLVELIPLKNLKEYQLAQIAYPVSDLSARLSYESEFGSEAFFQAEETATGTAKLLESLRLHGESLEQVSERRRWGLKSLHDKEYERFVRMEGFGVKRVRHTHLSAVAIPEIQDFTFQGSLDFIADQFGGGPRNWELPVFSRDESGEPLLPPKFDNPFLAAHVTSILDFVDPRGFGYIAEFAKVAGFVPHAFHRPANNINQAAGLRLDRLELVSLLRFSTAQVYVLDHLPRMDELSSENAPRRNLDDFETFAMYGLERGDGVVTRQDGGLVRMLGAIPAQKSCLQCHQIKEGGLLGAFSYQFSPHTDELLKRAKQKRPTKIDGLRQTDSPTDPINEILDLRIHQEVADVAVLDLIGFAFNPHLSFGF